MIDLTYNKQPDGLTVEVTGVIPVTNVIEMMSQEHATRFICHALMNIIKGHDLDPLGVDYRMAYLTELLHSEEPHFEGTESFHAFQANTVNQFINMVEENFGKEATQGMRAYDACHLRDDVPRLGWLRKVHEKNPNACFTIDILCSTDGFHHSLGNLE